MLQNELNFNLILRNFKCRLIKISATVMVDVWILMLISESVMFGSKTQPMSLNQDEMSHSNCLKLLDMRRFTADFILKII